MQRKRHTKRQSSHTTGCWSNPTGITHLGMVTLACFNQSLPPRKKSLDKWIGHGSVPFTTRYFSALTQDEFNL